MNSSGLTLLRETLLSTRIVTEQQWNYAVKTAQLRQVSLEKVFVEMGVIEAEKISEIAEILYGIPQVHVDDYVIDPLVLRLLPRESAERYCAIPLYTSGSDRVTVAMVDPMNVEAVDAVRYIVQKDVRVVWISEDDFKRAIQLYGGEEVETARVQQILDDFKGSEPELKPEPTPREDSEQLLRLMAEEAPVIRLTSVLFAQALEARASDLHLEPGQEDAHVRIRVDGVLQNLMTLPMGIYAALASRLKLIGNMDITERRLPQDGRCESVVGGRTMDMRLATSPCLHGEKIVIRVVDPNARLQKLDDLGYSEDNLLRLRAMLATPHGMVLVTGPTGSGKTTTLYGAIDILNTPRVNIQTIEDPIERKIERVSQLQVHPRIGLTFARALKSFLRQDPDVIMVGEIRDLETAEIVVQAALTGHLVLSTLHTNDALGAVTRLVDMGVPGYMVAAALRGVVAQRLVRRICSQCAVRGPVTKEETRALLDQPGEITEAYRAVGCPACSGMGYVGRTVISEVLVMSPELQRGIVLGADTNDLLDAARMNGFITIREDALNKAAHGVTSMDELLRTTISHM